MDIIIQRMISNFQEKSNSKFIGIYNIETQYELYTIIEKKELAHSVSTTDCFNCIERAINISKSFPLNIISIEGVNESTLIKFLNTETVLIVTYVPIKSAISDTRNFIIKFSMQYSKSDS